jgi:ABC-type glycerol-3-phosphate transport system substrate-binding protein
MGVALMVNHSRRTFLQTTAIAAGATFAGPYVKTAHSAGKLALGLWDHWVPGANDVLAKMCQDWAAANNVELTVDFIASAGDKLTITGAAEARARTGHDIFALPTWQVTIHKEALEPVDDLMEELTKEYGPYNDSAAYLCKHDGSWRAVVAPTGSHTKGMVSRLDLFKQHAGIDLQALFPAGARDQGKIDAEWTYDTFLRAARQLHAAGYPFGNPIGQTSDSQDWLGPLFLSFGAQMVSPSGEITVDSDNTRAAIEYMRQLTQYMPQDVYAWDDAANNRWIISGSGSCIQNPPSAWAVAVRDQPAVGAQLWHHDTPSGPAGRFRGSLPFSWGIWNFAQNIPAAKELLLHLSQKEQTAVLVKASRGYDLPLQPAFFDNPVWETEGPPRGTLYNYPSRGNEDVIVSGYPAPPGIAAKIYTESLVPNLVARVTQTGESPDDAIAWATEELEGYLRS